MEKERVELEKRGWEREKAHAGCMWAWVFFFAFEVGVLLGLVEEVDEVVGEGG